ncbi:TadE family type IV pilus minor pilin [Nocardioides sp. TRM66260-LWL]|uniref:TadE family type IV pilus minor pilin n=1 Tax=Nocardioides sp. TRM66260-LWL TaxID=2874478 RepID=UPI0027E079C5|nr:TadE family type IV pilus minor pilin [Nocardioides sp. TRM66260-LWL]
MTAETVMVLPLLVLLTAALCWLLAVGAAQVRAVDAARETARLAARGDTDAVAIDAGRRVAPSDAQVVLSRGGDDVTARVTGAVPLPGGLLDRLLPPARVQAEATAVVETAGATP